MGLWGGGGGGGIFMAPEDFLDLTCWFWENKVGLFVHWN